MRRPRGSTRHRWIPLLALAAVVAWLLWSQGRASEGEGGVTPGAPRLPREFRALVRAGGAPLAGAHVRLYEDVPGGFFTEGRAGEDGTLALSWTPTLLADPGELYLAAWDDAGRYARTIARALPAGTEIDLAEPADVPGRVVDQGGRPIAGAAVAAAVRHSFEEAKTARSDADGRFSIGLRAPKGAPLDLLVHAPGRAVSVQRRYRGGDAVTVHVAPGLPIRLRLVDPLGRPVAARARLAVPPALAAAVPSATAGPDGHAALEDASDGSRVAVDVEADGFLPAEAPGWPGLPATVILWPARDVNVVAWDAWNSKGVEGVRFDVEPHPVAGQEWWGPEPASVGRPVPVRPGATAGSYAVRLPCCKVTLQLAAPGYEEGSGDVPADATDAKIRLEPPLYREKPSLLVLDAPADTPPFDLIVADEEGGFLRRATLRKGRAEVQVPSRTRLQVGSGSAMDGLFLPKHSVDGVQPGKQRVVRLGTRPARLLKIRTDPPIDGEATLVSAELEKYVAPTRVPVRAGTAEFWVAPFRSFHLEVTPPPGFFPHEAEVPIAAEDQELEFHLLPAATLSYRVADTAGNPVPFATVLVYEPGDGGRMALEAPPREVLADADGLVRFDALRPGDAALEFGSDLFRSRRAIVKLPFDGAVDGGTVVLEPRGVVSGTAVDARGAPLRGVQVRVIPPRIAWLPMPGGGSRELYDLTETSLGDGVTDENGDFSVPDRSPKPPLVALYPPVASGLAPMAFEPGGRHALVQAAFVELELPTSPQGVYLLLAGQKALLVKNDPPLSLRPLPLLLPSGRMSLFAKLRDRRWGSKEIELRPGETARLDLDWRR